jgi:hypothetical protein
MVDLEKYMVEVQQLPPLTEEEREHLRKILTFTPFQKAAALMAEEINGAAARVLATDANNAVAIAQIQGKVQGYLRLIEIINEEAHKNDRDEPTLDGRDGPVELS